MFLNEVANGIGRFCALPQPVLEPLTVDLDLRLHRERVISPDSLNESSVARCLGGGDNNLVERSFLSSATCQTNFNRH